MCSWDSLVADCEKFCWEESTSSQLEDLGRSLLKVKSSDIVKRFETVITDNALFSAYSQHFEFPRPLMDKFVLHMDPADRFRIRLHRFKPKIENRGAEAWVHDHRWPFVSLILSGSYAEDRYHVADCNDSGYAKLELVSSRRLIEGCVNFGPAQIPHSTVNDGDTIPCYSLFVRGPSLHEYSRIFDLAQNSYIPSFGLRRELLEQCSLAFQAIVGQ